MRPWTLVFSTLLVVAVVAGFLGIAGVAPGQAASRLTGAGGLVLKQSIVPQAGATAGPGLNLAGLFEASPGQKFDIGGGKMLTAAEIWAALDAALTPMLKGPFFAKRAIATPVAGAAVIAAQSTALLAEMQRLAASPPAGPVKALPENGQPPRGKLAGAGALAGTNDAVLAGRPPVPCNQRDPYVGSFKGVITPGGGIGITGQCFGTSGEIRIAGTSTNFFIRLQNAVWTDGVIGATLPSTITGVFDQAVTVEVVRTDGRKSVDLKKMFVATKLPEIDVPTELIKLVQCGGRNDCGKRQAVHRTDPGQDTPPTLSGADIWQVTLPKGWQLTTLRTYNEVGAIEESGFELGSPEAATITYKYTSTAVAQPHGFNFPDIGNDRYACAKYSMEINAIGPVGIPIE